MVSAMKVSGLQCSP